MKMESCFMCVVVACSLMLAGCANAAEQNDLAAMLAQAKKGTTITLEAKTYSAGDLVIPAGVTLRGAGFDKTIIDAKGHMTGLSLEGAKATASDLTVRNASGNGIAVIRAAEFRISQVRVTDCLMALQIEKAENGRVENVIVSANRTGAILLNSQTSSIVNCSFINNSAVALSISGNRDVAVFNNIFVGSATGVIVSADNKGLLLDHNLYFVNYIGKLASEPSRTSLPAWQRLSGFDTHSVTMRVDFQDAAKEDFRAVSALSWSPSLATTSPWGTAKLGSCRHL